MSDCDRCLDAGAYVLGALEDHEVPGFTAHLAGCLACAEEVHFLQVAADTLPVTAPAVAPPPALKGRLMAIVDSEAQLLRAAGPEADRAPSAPRRSWRERMPRLGRLVLRPQAAAGLACGLLAIGVGGTVLVEHTGNPTTRVVPGAVTASTGASAKLLVRGHQGTLQLAAMPEPPTGQTYQVWFHKRGTPASKLMATHTLFNVRSDGRASVPITEAVTGVDQVLVTAEPNGGSRRPTSDPVITAQL